METRKLTPEQQRLRDDLNQQVDDLEAWFGKQPPDQVVILLVALLGKKLAELPNGSAIEWYVLQFAEMLMDKITKRHRTHHGAGIPNAGKR